MIKDNSVVTQQKDSLENLSCQPSVQGQDGLKAKGQGQQGKRQKVSCCLRCGRRLKDSTSQLWGYGPCCYKKIAVSYSKSLFVLKK